MRKLILLSSVFALTMGVFAQKEADAFLNFGFGGFNPNASTKHEQNETQQTIKDEQAKTQQTIKDEQEILYERLKEQYQLMGAQRDTVATANNAQMARYQSASDMNRAIGLQQQAHVAAYSKLSGLDEMACSLLTSQASYGNAHTTYLRAKKENEEKRQAVMANAAGTIGENGDTDKKVTLYPQILANCLPGSDGGALTCSGDGEHTNIAIALRPNLGQSGPTSSNDAEQLEFIQNVAYHPEFISVNPDLYDNPNTNMKALLVESDRLRTFASIGQAVMTDLIASRTPTQGGRAIEKIRETLLYGDYLNEQEVDEIIPASGVSISGYRDALSLALMNSNYMREKFISNPDTIPVMNAYTAGIQIQLMNDMIKKLEKIALATSANTTLLVDDEVDENNAKRSAVNSRNMASR